MCPISDLQACKQHALSCRARHECRREISGSRDHAMCNIQNRTSSSSPADKSSKCVIMCGNVFNIYIYKVAAQAKEVAARASCTARCIRYLICSLLPCPILPKLSMLVFGMRWLSGVQGVMPCHWHQGHAIQASAPPIPPTKQIKSVQWLSHARAVAFFSRAALETEMFGWAMVSPSLEVQKPLQIVYSMLPHKQNIDLPPRMLLWHLYGA
jgi:hypothetical protein